MDVELGLRNKGPPTVEDGGCSIQSDNVDIVQGPSSKVDLSIVDRVVPSNDLHLGC